LEPLCRSLQAAGAVGILASSVGGHFFWNFSFNVFEFVMNIDWINDVT
jgi:hypothetical protein